MVVYNFKSILVSGDATGCQSFVSCMVYLVWDDKIIYGSLKAGLVDKTHVWL